MLQHNHNQSNSPTVTDEEIIASLTELAQEAPALPENALQEVLSFLNKLPYDARMTAAQLIAGKASYDFAMRFLLDLGHAVEGSNQWPPEFDLTDQGDQEAISELVQEWVAIVKNIRVTSLEALRRCVGSAIGLQLLMGIAPDNGTYSWVYDAGTQYRVALQNARMLAEQSFSAYRLSPHEIHYERISAQPVTPVHTSAFYTQLPRPKFVPVIVQPTTHVEK